MLVLFYWLDLNLSHKLSAVSPRSQNIVPMHCLQIQNGWVSIEKLNCDSPWEGAKPNSSTTQLFRWTQSGPLNWVGTSLRVHELRCIGWHLNEMQAWHHHRLNRIEIPSFQLHRNERRSDVPIWSGHLFEAFIPAVPSFWFNKASCSVFKGCA